MSFLRVLPLITDNMIDLDVLWLRRGTIGVALTEAFYSPRSDVTVDSLAARVKMTDDTVRRALNTLVLAGMVNLEIVEGRRRYCAKKEAAEQTLALLNRALPQRPQDAV